MNELQIYYKPKEQGQLLVLSLVGLIIGLILVLSFAGAIQTGISYAVNNTTNDIALPLIKMSYGLLIIAILISIVILIRPQGV